MGEDVIVDENVVRHDVTEKENVIADENVVQYDDAELEDIIVDLDKRKTILLLMTMCSG